MKYLKDSILLCEEQNNANQKLFTIVKKLERGSSVVCYEAYHESSGRGILKEFYPNDTSAMALERNSEGQLILSKDVNSQHERFYQSEQEYLEPYKRLLSIKQQGENRDLDTFIPSFEIYRGCSKEGKAVGTVYVWSPEPELETFDKICEEIHKNPTVNPEQKLATVLTAIKALVNCTEALHRSDIIHRDIKPSNFGFLKRGNEILTQTISLFDVNSMCDIFTKSKIEMGSIGYTEPEAADEHSTTQTDIYSIGATLFHAIIVTDEVKKNKYLFKEEYYDNLRELVNNSKLIQASEANSHPHLRNALTTILQKCLCERDSRYAGCEDLYKDVEDALYYALPSDVAKRMKAGQRWVLADAEKKFDKTADKNSTVTIKYHLYEHPLYTRAKSNATNLNILVFGFGNYGQKFLDACLQAGQMRGKTLNVTVVSDSDIDKTVYLSDRPALGEFFNIDGESNEQDVYGNISFEKKELNRINRKEITTVIQDIVCEQSDKNSIDYIFIALGDDKLNLAMAKACREAVEVLEQDGFVSFVCEDSKIECETSEICPVYVNNDIRKSPLHTEIERMAFNTHLVWEKNLNINFSKVRAEFRKPYNHDASVSSVLSIKYKLFSMGIDLDHTTLEEAAKLFTDKMSNDVNKQIRDELIWIEHRRWVTEKVCLGWQRLSNLDECASGVTKDERRKRHICILRSAPEQKLSTEHWRKNNFDKWDSASKDDMDKLDELERMSVELHRMYKRKANGSKKVNLMSNILEVQTLIEGNKKAVVTFMEWYSCLKDIWHDDLSKVRLYKGLKNAFLASLEDLPKNRKDSVKKHVMAFEAMFYPILASVAHRDWKQDDVALVDNIPFILTYTENIYMAIPYESSQNRLFDNVASATVVNPARILYLFLAKSPTDIAELISTIPYVMTYMNKKKLRAGVEFVIAYANSTGIDSETEIVTKIKEIGKERIRNIKMIALSNLNEFPRFLDEYLSQRNVKNNLLVVEKNDKNNLCSMLMFTSIYRNFANYEFTSAEMQFNALENCDILGYIKKTPYITVSDMLSLSMSSSESSNQPLFYSDYLTLWKKYYENSSLWKQLCDILGEHSEKNDLLISLKKKLPRERNQEAAKYVYFVPFACKKGANKIIEFLRKQELLEPGSKVVEYTIDSCKVTIKDKCGYKKLYDKLFSNVYALMFSKAITLHLNTKSHEVNVVFDNLQVKDVIISGGRKDDLIALLRYFAQEGYIINLVESNDEKLSFTYSTASIKELLTTAGKMLEVYTYHKVKELGEFDDVVSSFEIDWEDTEVKNELDCIITKGFRTVFIECKARTDIEQEFYYKIGRLADEFGINPTAVLIADTQERSFYDNAPVNAMQRKRGEMMDIITIWKKEEIDNIGDTLLRIVNGEYKNK